MKALRTLAMISASVTTLAVAAFAWPIVAAIIQNRLDARS